VSGGGLYDDLGPRGRRHTRAGTGLTLVAFAVLLALAVRRLEEEGQLDAALWQPFTEWAIWRFLLGGLLATLEAALAAMGLALLLGAGLALCRLAAPRPLRSAATGYIELLRAVPVLLFIYFAALGLPRYGIDLSPFWYLVLPLGLYHATLLAEVLRAGILSLDRGQAEAAQALGLPWGQTMRLVVLPQAVRRMSPALVSQLVVLLKDTSLGYVIPYEELLRRGQIAGEFAGNLLASLVVVALMYVLVNLALSRLAARLDRAAPR
jgi:glutamate transport system permease protein